MKLLLALGSTQMVGAAQSAVTAHHKVADEGKIAAHMQRSTLSALAARFRHMRKGAGSEHGGVGSNPDIAAAVTALEELAGNLEKEQAAAAELNKGREKKCSADLSKF